MHQVPRLLLLPFFLFLWDGRVSRLISVAIDHEEFGHEPETVLRDVVEKWLPALQTKKTVFCKFFTVQIIDSNKTPLFPQDTQIFHVDFSCEMM